MLQMSSFRASIVLVASLLVGGCGRKSSSSPAAEPTLEFYGGAEATGATVCTQLELDLLSGSQASSAQSDLTVTLTDSDSSSTLAFYSDAGCSTKVTTMTMKANTSKLTVYVMDTAKEDTHIVASASGCSSASPYLVHVTAAPQP